MDAKADFAMCGKKNRRGDVLVNATGSCGQAISLRNSYYSQKKSYGEVYLISYRGGAFKKL